MEDAAGVAIGAKIADLIAAISAGFTCVHCGGVFVPGALRIRLRQCKMRVNRKAGCRLGGVDPHGFQSARSSILSRSAAARMGRAWPRRASSQRTRRPMAMRRYNRVASTARASTGSSWGRTSRCPVVPTTIGSCREGTSTDSAGPSHLSAALVTSGPQRRRGRTLASLKASRRRDAGKWSICNVQGMHSGRRTHGSIRCATCFRRAGLRIHARASAAAPPAYVHLH